MQPTRILPDLQCSLLCEDIRQEASGNFILLGIVNLVAVPQLPIIASKLYVFNRWTAGVGQFTEVTRLVAPDQTTVLRKSEIKFALQEPSANTTNVTMFQQVEFRTTGTYFIEVTVDDVMKLRYPVPVVQVQRPGHTHPPTPPAGPPGPAESPSA